MWEVRLTKMGSVYQVYKRSFFPRRFRYKREALQQIRGVEGMGGEAILVDMRKVTKESKIHT